MLVDGCRDRDHGHVGVGGGLVIGAGGQPPGLHQRREELAIDVLEVGAAAVDQAHLGRVEVDANNSMAGLRDRHGQGQPDVAEADHDHLGVAALDL